MYKKCELIKQLNLFEKAKGKPVIVHSSLKSVGECEGRGEGLLSVLIDYFTADNGLLCIPTHTWTEDFMDLRENKSCIGILPAIATGYEGGIRSMHPTHSMVIFGQNAKEFACGEEDVDSPTHPDGCYGKIYKQNGYVLLVGVGQEKNTYLHCVEEMLGVTKRYLKEKVRKGIIHKDGSVQERYLWWFDDSEIPDVSKNFGKFEKAFRYHGCITDGFVGNAPAMLCDAVKMKEVMELIYERSQGEELLADKNPLKESLYK